MLLNKKRNYHETIHDGAIGMKRGVASPKILGRAKMFDFRQITLYCLVKRL